MTGKLMSAFKKLEKEIVRKTILTGEPRIDGRDQDTVRPVLLRQEYYQELMEHHFLQGERRKHW